MENLPLSLEKLIEQIRHIPSVGKKSATRMSFSILDYTQEECENLANAILDVKKHITQCPICCGLSEDGEVCDICSSPNRDKSLICVVEDYKAAIAIESVHEFNGTYHVLHGVLSPLNGVTPDKLKINELISRVTDGSVKEVIIATNPNVEGEATASYISKLLNDHNVKVSRLAYGMPVGGELEYTDSGTLSRALNGRSIMK